ncbi:hypothetical protein [Streptomyces sp. UNOB3_S3]|uniref:hypothetical protein n=1 Tax=Streptomyces sp. UNOB3_S3 TaxID=2871682 RepID=UPI001E3324EF|nr:hypothetical protein [Streptomyces sp. UNOB3_S3]MCC3775567.1 hypothetical protein [Streptomyces sp. UNOB3_S3]
MASVSSVRPSSRRLAVLGVALAATVTLTGATVGNATAASDTAPKRASVTGSAEFELPFWKDKDVRSFTFDAHAKPYSRPLAGLPTGLPTDAEGTVKVSHYVAALGRTMTAEGKVDCLVTGPGVASLTAVMTKVSPDGPQEWVGKRLGFSVLDGGKEKAGHKSKDRVGFSWAAVNVLRDGDKGAKEPVSSDVGTCMSSAPYAPVTKGGYTVHHAELPPVPKG